MNRIAAVIFSIFLISPLAQASIACHAIGGAMLAPAMPALQDTSLVSLRQTGEELRLYVAKEQARLERCRASVAPMRFNQHIARLEKITAQYNGYVRFYNRVASEVAMEFKGR